MANQRATKKTNVTFVCEKTLHEKMKSEAKRRLISVSAYINLTIHDDLDNSRQVAQLMKDPSAQRVFAEILTNKSFLEKITEVMAGKSADEMQLNIDGLTNEFMKPAKTKP